MHLRQKEDVWTTAYNIPVRFLKDGLRECIRDGILTKTPFSLNIKGKDVYLVETEDGFMGLNMSNEQKMVELARGPVQIPGQSIIKYVY